MSHHVQSISSSLSHPPDITELLKSQARSIVSRRRDHLDAVVRGAVPLAGQTRALRGAARPLGTKTKSTSPAFDTSTGELLDEGSDDRAALASARNRTWALQEAAARLLPHERVAFCGKRRQSAEHNVEIRKSQDGKSFITRVQRCGSIHVCPCCGKKVASTRRLEVMHALTAWREMGFMVSMMTLTLPHYKDQDYYSVHTAINKITNMVNSGKRSIKNMLRDYGYQGQIRAFEVTLGDNGWHPHLHVILLHQTKLDQDIIGSLKDRWQAAAVSYGWAEPGWDVGLQVQDGQAAADYVTKSGWGMAEEVTLASRKKSSGGHNPYQLLELAALGNKQAGAEFREYATVMKGKRALYWSRGLKAFFGLNELTDQQLIDAEETRLHAQSLEVVASLPHDLWTLVLTYNARADLLDASDCGGSVAVVALLESLLSRAGRPAYRIAEVVT